MVGYFAALVLLALLVTPFAILLCASVFALTASQVGEDVAAFVASATFGGLLVGLKWWLSEVSRTFGVRQNLDA
jgi:hypothetical protein